MVAWSRADSVSRVQIAVCAEPDGVAGRRLLLHGDIDHRNRLHVVHVQQDPSQAGCGELVADPIAAEHAAATVQFRGPVDRGPSPGMCVDTAAEPSGQIAHANTVASPGGHGENPDRLHDAAGEDHPASANDPCVALGIDDMDGGSSATGWLHRTDRGSGAQGGARGHHARHVVLGQPARAAGHEGEWQYHRIEARE